MQTKMKRLLLIPLLILLLVSCSKSQEQINREARKNCDYARQMGIAQGLGGNNWAYQSCLRDEGYDRFYN